jgi:hypothetical protein
MKNEFFQLGIWMGLFSLTPALSRWEREKRSQLLGVATTVNCSTAHGLYRLFQRLFPLPAGEGQGEGERGVNLQPADSDKTNWS